MGGILLGVNGGGGVSEGNMSGSSHGSEMTALSGERFVMVERKSKDFLTTGTELLFDASTIARLA